MATAPRQIALVTRRVGDGREGRRPVTPTSPRGPRSAGSTPRGTARSQHQLVADRAVWLSQRVMRVTADNGSVMTGPGTNTLSHRRRDADDWALIDPGPATRRMWRRSRRGAGPITRIIVTHTHKDHSPAARR